MCDNVWDGHLGKAKAWKLFIGMKLGLYASKPPELSITLPAELSDLLKPHSQREYQRVQPCASSSSPFGVRTHASRLPFHLPAAHVCVCGGVVGEVGI